MVSTDIVIVGGGCVGLTLALALAQQDIPVAVIDSQPEVQPLADQPELRVSALSAGSQAIFTRLGVWQDMIDTRATPYNSMHVWEKDSFGAITFDYLVNYLQPNYWAFVNCCVKSFISVVKEDRILFNNSG